jgi:hypothetical protein
MAAHAKYRPPLSLVLTRLKFNCAGTIAFQPLDAATSYGDVKKRDLLRATLAKYNPRDLRNGDMASFNSVIEDAYSQLGETIPDGPAKDYLLDLIQLVIATRCLGCQHIGRVVPYGFHLPKLGMAAAHNYTTPFDPAYSDMAVPIPGSQCQSCGSEDSTVQEPAKLPPLLIVPIPELVHVCACGLILSSGFSDGSLHSVAHSELTAIGYDWL